MRKQDLARPKKRPLIRAKAKVRFAMRELKYPCGYIHPSGHVIASVCFKDRNGIWQAGYKTAHREIFSWWHKITLTSSDSIHHVDHDKLNNHWTNLSRMHMLDHLATARASRRKRVKV